MPPPKPRNAPLKDSVVAYLTLKAHFAIADNYPNNWSTSSSSVPEGNSSPGVIEDRMLVAFEKSVELAEIQMRSHEIQMRSQARDDAIRTIREMLDTFGDEMSPEEMQSHRTRLRALHSEKLAGAGGAGGAGGPAPH